MKLEKIVVRRGRQVIIYGPILEVMDYLRKNRDECYLVKQMQVVHHPRNWLDELVVILERVEDCD